MNSQQLQVTAYRHIAGAVQVPLVMLVWGALVLFFGLQYQANALLPADNPLDAIVSLESDDLLRAQQRNDRLLAQLAAQTPVPIPSLLDRQAFAAELAAELADYELKTEAQQTPSTTPVSTEAPPIASSISSSAAAEQSVLMKVAANVSSERVVLESVSALPVTERARRKSKIKTSPNLKAAKFVRLPAVVQRNAVMRVDVLRTVKDSARQDLLVGRSDSAYKRLRGQIAQGRTDIEFLGLLALASLQQQPGEAEVIYQHLIQLQPEAQRWQQGLSQSQRMLAQRSTYSKNIGEPTLSQFGDDGDDGDVGQSGLAG